MRSYRSTDVTKRCRFAGICVENTFVTCDSGSFFTKLVFQLACSNTTTQTTVKTSQFMSLTKHEFSEGIGVECFLCSPIQRYTLDFENIILQSCFNVVTRQAIKLWPCTPKLVNQDIRRQFVGHFAQSTPN